MPLTRSYIEDWFGLMDTDQDGKLDPEIACNRIQRGMEEGCYCKWVPMPVP